MQKYQGGCHCQAVRFEVEADLQQEIQSCNCSMCLKLGYIHLIVPQQRFRLLTGQDQLSSYTFNTGVAKHLFCSQCGIKSYYVPRSNPDGISVNVRCLDDIDLTALNIDTFDGQNWEQHGAELSRLSRD